MVYLLSTVIVVVVINQWSKDTYPVLTSLVDRPIDSLESLLIILTQGRHEAQRVAHTHSQGLAPDGASTHGLKRVHNLSDPAEDWIAGVCGGIEWLSRGGNNILI